MNPQTALHWGAAITLATSVIGFLIANRGSIGAGLSRLKPSPAPAPMAESVDDDTLDFQALRRLQKRSTGKADVIAALKVVAASFIEG